MSVVFVSTVMYTVLHTQPELRDVFTPYVTYLVINLTAVYFSVIGYKVLLATTSRHALATYRFLNWLYQTLGCLMPASSVYSWIFWLTAPPSLDCSVNRPGLTYLAKLPWQCNLALRISKALKSDYLNMWYHWQLEKLGTWGFHYSQQLTPGYDVRKPEEKLQAARFSLLCRDGATEAPVSMPLSAAPHFGREKWSQWKCAFERAFDSRV